MYLQIFCRAFLVILSILIPVNSGGGSVHPQGVLLTSNFYEVCMAGESSPTTDYSV